MVPKNVSPHFFGRPRLEDAFGVIFSVFGEKTSGGPTLNPLAMAQSKRMSRLFRYESARAAETDEKRTEIERKWSENGPQNGAKSGPLEGIISTTSAPWTPLGTKHVQRRPKDTTISEKLTSKLQPAMKKHKTDVKTKTPTSDPVPLTKTQQNTVSDETTQTTAQKKEGLLK